MKSDVVNLRQLLEGGKQYIVPQFQRNYTWKQNNWKALWDDLISLTGEGEKERRHFLGPVITLPTEPDPAGLSKFLLIDGQQRITTLCVLLNAIRSHARLNAPDLDEELLEEFLINKRKPGLEHYKLLSGTYDLVTYVQIINLEVPKDRNNKLSSAFDFFKNKLSKTQKDLKTIKDALLGRMTLISIVLDKNDNPYEVFESINSKGLSLTEAELIKNYLLMQVNSSDQHERVFAQYWNPMEESLGDKLTEFIRHFEMRKSKVVKNKEVYHNVRLSLKERDAVEHMEYMKELHRFSGYYERFLDPEKEANRYVRKFLDPIRKFDNTVVYPYFMNLFEHNHQGHIDDVQLIKCLQIVENLLVRRLLINDGNQGLNKEMPRLHDQAIAKVSASISYPQALQTTVANAKSFRYVSDDRLQNMKTEPVFGGGNKSTLSHVVMNRIEDYLSNKEPGTSNYVVIRLMPDILDEDWSNYLPPADRQHHRDYVDLIGNLALIPEQEQGPNEKHSYHLKRAKLLDSGLSVNRAFDEIEDWNVNQIKKRTEELIDSVKKIWPELGNGGGYARMGDENDPTGKKPIAYSFMGQEFQLSEQTWKNLYVTVLNQLLALDSNSFKAAAEENRIQLSPFDSFHNSGALDKGLHVNTGLSALSVLRNINSMLASMGFDEEDFSYTAVER